METSLGKQLAAARARAFEQIAEKAAVEWDSALLTEMERRFNAPTNSEDHENLRWDDTQLGVEFAIEWIKKHAVVLWTGDIR